MLVFVAETHGATTQFQLYFCSFAFCLLDSVFEREELTNLLQNYFCHYLQIFLSVQEDGYLFQKRWLFPSRRRLVEALPLGLFKRDESAALRELPVGQPIHRMIQQLCIIESRHVLGRVSIDRSRSHGSLTCLLLKDSQLPEAIQSRFALLNQRLQVLFQLMIISGGEFEKYGRAELLSSLPCLFHPFFLIVFLVTSEDVCAVEELQVFVTKRYQPLDAFLPKCFFAGPYVKLFCLIPKPLFQTNPLYLIFPVAIFVLLVVFSVQQAQDKLGTTIKLYQTFLNSFLHARHLSPNSFLSQFSSFQSPQVGQHFHCIILIAKLKAIHSQAQFVHQLWSFQQTQFSYFGETIVASIE